MWLLRGSLGVLASAVQICVLAGAGWESALEIGVLAPSLVMILASTSSGVPRDDTASSADSAYFAFKPIAG